MSSKKEKIWMLLHELKREYQKQLKKIDEKPLDKLSSYEREVLIERIAVKRWNLKLIIQNQLKIVDSHTINHWVNLLLSECYLLPNPTSQLSSKQQLIKPTNDTRYFISINDIEAGLDFIREEIFPHTHTIDSKQLNIDKFFSGSSDHQKDNKNNS